MSILMYVCVSVCAYTDLCLHICTYVCLSVCIQIYVYTYVRMCVCLCIFAVQGRWERGQPPWNHSTTRTVPSTGLCGGSLCRVGTSVKASPPSTLHPPRQLSNWSSVLCNFSWCGMLVRLCLYAETSVKASPQHTLVSFATSISVESVSEWLGNLGLSAKHCINLAVVM